MLEFIDNLRDGYGVEPICDVLPIAPSTYYRYKRLERYPEQRCARPIRGSKDVSMGRKGNCWDNAAIESFFGRFKVETLYAEDVKNKQKAYSCVFDYIDMFYNSHRRHSTLGNMSPNQFEQEYARMCA